MPMHGPDRPAPDALSRFPLAARALRPSAAGPAKPSAPRTLPPAAAVPAAPRVAAAPNNWPLYAFIFLLPLQNIHLGYLPSFPGGLNFLNVMFAVSLLTAIALGGRLAQREPVNLWVALFAMHAVISLIIGAGRVAGAGEHANLLKDQLLGMFMVYLVQMGVQDWSGVRKVLLATLLPLPYIAKVVWVQHQSVASWHYSDDLRISGTFSTLNANEFAAFCVTVAIMLFALLVAARLSRYWRLAVLGGIAAMVMGVLYAYSRTGYVALMLGLVVVLLAWRGRWKMVLPLLLAAALAPALLPNSVVERFDSTTVDAAQRDQSTELRFELWRLGWNNFIDNPIVGTGYHTFHHREINQYGKDAHNLYIRTLTESGLAGAMVLLGLLLSVLHLARRELVGATSGSLRYALALGLVGAWVALVCGNLFGDRFTYYPMIAYFWVYVGLVLKARHLPAEGRLR